MTTNEIASRVRSTAIALAARLHDGKALGCLVPDPEAAYWLAVGATTAGYVTPDNQHELAAMLAAAAASHQDEQPCECSICKGA